MKTLLFGFAALSATIFLTGCEPEIAQVKHGAKEAVWESAIKESYPGWKAPVMAPQAIDDNRDKAYFEAEKRKKEAAAAEEEAAMAVFEGEEEAVTEEVAATEENGATEEAIVAAPTDNEGAAKTVEYVVEKGDSLSLIAKKFYKDGRKYHRIIVANEATLGGNPNLLRPGMKLVIPVEE